MHSVALEGIGRGITLSKQVHVCRALARFVKLHASHSEFHIAPLQDLNVRAARQVRLRHVE